MYFKLKYLAVKTAQEIGGSMALNFLILIIYLLTSSIVFSKDIFVDCQKINLQSEHLIKAEHLYCKNKSLNFEELYFEPWNQFSISQNKILKKLKINNLKKKKKWGFKSHLGQTNVYEIDKKEKRIIYYINHKQDYNNNYTMIKIFVTQINAFEDKINALEDKDKIIDLFSDISLSKMIIKENINNINNQEIVLNFYSTKSLLVNRRKEENQVDSKSNSSENNSINSDIQSNEEDNSAEEVAKEEDNSEEDDVGPRGELLPLLLDEEDNNVEN